MPQRASSTSLHPQRPSIRANNLPLHHRLAQQFIPGIISPGLRACEAASADPLLQRWLISSILYDQLNLLSIIPVIQSLLHAIAYSILISIVTLTIPFSAIAGSKLAGRCSQCLAASGSTMHRELLHEYNSRLIGLHPVGYSSYCALRFQHFSLYILPLFRAFWLHKFVC